MSSSRSSHYLLGDSSLSFIQQYDLFNEEINIYRTIIVCDNHNKKDIHNVLDENGYSVYMNNDFNEFLTRNMRVFIMSIDEYYKCSPQTITTMTHEHNMIITYKLDETNSNEVVSRFINSRTVLDISKHYYIWIN